MLFTNLLPIKYQPIYIPNSKHIIFLKILFNWRIIALQSCVGFCCTMWISHTYIHIYIYIYIHIYIYIYIYIPLPLEPPSPSYPNMLHILFNYQSNWLKSFHCFNPPLIPTLFIFFLILNPIGSHCFNLYFFDYP